MKAELVTATLTVIKYSDTRPLEFLLSEPTGALLSILWSSSAQMFVAHVPSDCRLQLNESGNCDDYGLACRSQPTTERRYHTIYCERPNNFLLLLFVVGVRFLHIMPEYHI
jgi:hypothetical protein